MLNILIHVQHKLKQNQSYKMHQTHGKGIQKAFNLISIQFKSTFNISIMPTTHPIYQISKILMSLL